MNTLLKYIDKLINYSDPQPPKQVENMPLNTLSKFEDCKVPVIKLILVLLAVLESL